MSWTSMLYRTYESNAANAGKEEEGGVSLSVTAHMSANAQLEITIDESGTFVGARAIPKGEGKMLIPVTESSAVRSSGSAPHALCDTLSYLAGDYVQYVDIEALGDEKKKDKFLRTQEKKHTDYIAALKTWAENGQYTHKKVRAVCRYLEKKEMIRDLIGSGLVKVENGRFTEDKISGAAYEKALAAFRVIIAGEDAAVSDAVWKDDTLRRSYSSYYLSQQGGRKDICYVTGDLQPVAEKHPKGIAAASYGAKLLSSNDAEGFTFRGRFTDAQEAYAVGYDSTQKIHSALTYLAAKQGITVGTKDKRTFLCWNPGGKEVEGFAVDFGFLEGNEKLPDTQAEYKSFLYQTLSGYKNKLDITDDIVMMGMDAATTGRLSITYYNEFKAPDFMERIEYWYRSCIWYCLTFTQEGRPEYKVKNPSLKEIVKFAYGTQQDKFVDVNDKVLKEQIQRLIYCMLDGHSIPADMVRALVSKASAPMAYTRGSREKLLWIACAVIAKRDQDGKKGKGEEYAMELDLNNTNRSYLYGRMLAVYEKIERRAMEKREDRETNAIRLQAAYVNHPFTVRKNLETILLPYLKKLPKYARNEYKDLITTITAGFQTEDEPELNKKLKEDYLLGYYLQRMELNKPRTEKEEEKE